MKETVRQLRYVDVHVYLYVDVEFEPLLRIDVLPRTIVVYMQADNQVND